jgi:hypothetical protein
MYIFGDHKGGIRNGIADILGIVIGMTFNPGVDIKKGLNFLRPFLWCVLKFYCC